MSSLRPPPQPTPPGLIAGAEELDEVVTTGRIPRVFVPPPQPVRASPRRWWLYALTGWLVLAPAAGFLLLYPVLLPPAGSQAEPQATPVASTPVASPVYTPTSDELRTAAAGALDRCMNEQALFTSCGFGWGGLKGGATPDLSTLHWTYHAGSSNTLGEAEFVIAPQAVTATAPISITVDIDVYDTAGIHYVDSMTLTNVSVDFTDPAAPVVSITPA